ncbi:MAG: VWA domain-containing protein [Pedosphaera sp.]|nr:VWA domain-containing protein [Pedosphaera sp.]
MSFASQFFLALAALLIPATLVFLIWTWRLKQQAVRRFVSTRLLAALTVGVSKPRQIVKRILLGMAVCFVLLSLAQPQWGFREEEARLRGVDIMVALDTSKSMLATDIRPNRLERAKLAAQDLLGIAKTDRLGLVAFAGSAFLQCPLTLDEEAFRTTLTQLDTETIPQGGTALGEAINTAVEAFSKEGGGGRVLVLMTDGEDHEEGAVEAARKAADAGVRIFTIGIGTPNGEILFTADPYGNKIFIKDSGGNAVKSQLDESLLKKIAEAGNGFYVLLQNAQSIAALYQKGIAVIPKLDGAVRSVRARQERFQWPLGLAIFLLALEILLPDHRRAAPRELVRPLGSVAGPAVVALWVMLFLFPTTVSASGRSANRAYAKGDYKSALREYEELMREEPENHRLQFNAGAAAFKLGQSAEALKHFEGATRDPDLNFQGNAYYNLGTVFAKLGEQADADQEKLGHLEKALKNFDDALQLKPDNADAKHNRDLVKKRLEELQKKMPPDPNKKSDKEKQDKDSKDPKDGQSQKKEDSQEEKSEKNPDGSPKSDPSKQDPSPGSDKPDGQKAEDQPPDSEQKKGSKPSDKKEGAEKKPESSGNTPEEQQQAEERETQAAAQAGKMTPAMANKLLDSTKNNEKAMIFRMVDRKPTGKERTRKEW